MKDQRLETNWPTKNPAAVTSSRNPLARLRLRFDCRQRLLAAVLTMGLAALVQTARADVAVLDDDFNNATNNLANNDLGLGGGYTTFTAVQGQVRELNSQAQVASINNGADRAVLASLNYADVSAAGTVFDFTNVTFTNTTTTGAPLTDRLILGVIATNLAADWFESGPASTPQGFYFEPNSEGLATSTAAGNNNTLWTNHNSVLYYKGPGANITILQRFQFQTLSWNNGPGNWTNYSPVLDVKFTLSATGWKFDITGDVNTNGQPISFSGTYADYGITNIDFLSGIDHPYVGAEDQTEGPCIRMSIDRILVTHLGNLVVTTPAFSTPEYGGNVNTVFAGEQVDLSSFVNDLVATPTLHWQLEDLSSPGTFTNLPSGSGTNVSVDTSGLGDSQPRGIRLLASDTMGNSVTSAVVTLTVNPASAPFIVQDVTPSVLNLYPGQGGTFSAIFGGNKPMSFQWQLSTDGGSTFNNIPGATNNSYIIYSAQASDAGIYQLVATNAVNTSQSGWGYVTILSGTPKYLWSAAIPFAGLTADQVLTNFPSTNKIAGAWVGKNGGSPITVTPSSGSPIVFAGNGTGWAAVSGGNGYATGANTNQSGNANFNTCLNDYYSDGGVQTLVMSNLIVGQQYQVQLFALDDRGQYKARTINWQDPADVNDISATYAMGDHAYMLGTFTASNTVERIQQNQIASAGNFNCLVLRAVGWNPPPYFTAEPKSGGTYAGGSFTFSGGAAGDATIPNPTISYQWMAGPAGGPYSNLVEGAKYLGTTTATLTVSNLVASDGLPVYVLQASNGGGTITSGEATLNVVPPPAQNIVGQWLAGATNLADASGFASAGMHDGYFVGANNITVYVTNADNSITTNSYFAPLPGTNYWFTGDVPPGRTGMAIHLVNIGIAITNSSTLDSSYLNTYDDTIKTNFTVMFWAKGAPGAFSWNPWVSKYGDGNPAIGWQFRVGGANDAQGRPVPCWTVRDGSAGSYSVVGAGPSWSMNGDQDDMHAAISGTGSGATYLGVGNNTWHHYAGTYDVNTGIRNLYVDGVLCAREINNVQYTLSPASHLVIGARDNGGNSFGNYFTGNIYDVRIYTSAMTQPQIISAGSIPPPLTTQTMRGLSGGGQLVLTWPWGTLLEATNVAGPWVTNAVQTSPFTNNMSLPSEFFKASYP